MAEHDVAVKLENNEQQIKQLKHRMDSQEKQDEAMQDLIVSVKLLATNMENMIAEQKEQGDRLAALKKKPADNWNVVVRTLLTAAVSAIAGGAVVATLNLM